MKKEKLTISITLEGDNQTIALVDVNGCVHNMYEESKEEKELYQTMSVKDFIRDYVEYYQSAKDGEIQPNPEHWYAVQIKNMYWVDLDNYVADIKGASLYRYPRAVYIQEVIVQEKEDIEATLGFAFEEKDIKIIQVR